MNLLNIFLKSEIFSQDYKDEQFQESFKKVKEEAEVVFKIIQKYNPDLTKEKMAEMFKLPEKPSLEKYHEHMQKFIKVVSLEAFKEISLAFLPV